MTPDLLHEDFDPALLRFFKLPAALEGKTSLAQLNQFLAALDNESDRGLVLIVASICDELCLQWLKEVFNHGNSKVRKELFGFPGPFSSFSGRIKSLFALGKIDKELFDDLELIRALRNDRAHEWVVFRFTKELTAQFINPLFKRGGALMTPQKKMRWIAFFMIERLSAR